jgi:hypothetical protein
MDLCKKVGDNNATFDPLIPDECIESKALRYVIDTQATGSVQTGHL